MANFNSHHSSSLGCWDLHNLELLNADISSYNSNLLNMENNNAPSSFLSTGYLEDALIEFSVRFKRRRLMVCSNVGRDEYDHHGYDPSPTQFTDDLSCWSNWCTNYNIHSEEELSYASLFPRDMLYSTGECMEKSMAEMCEEIKNFPEANTFVLDEVVSGTNTTPKLEEINSSFKDNSIKTKSTSTLVYSTSDTTYSSDSSSISEEMIKKKKVNSRSGTTKMVYPLGLVKPGAEDGDITLNEINRRILMPPTRPLKHPVGDYAYRPTVSPHGLGLSGKAVVALTRIQTQGRGTITIIRTKG